MDNDLLICQDTGEYDWAYIKRMALIRAQANHRSEAPPMSWVRDEIRALQDRAQIMRLRWRRDHGLPDDTVYCEITPYGVQREGVRRSAF